MAKKKKRPIGAKLEYRERKMRQAHPALILGLYFTVCSLIGYPLSWLALTYLFKVPATSTEVWRMSIGIGIAGAAYFGVVAKARK